MGEGILPGGVFRKSAPGEFQINIPGVAEDPVNRIIRKAYRGKRKGESQARTKDQQRLFPRGFTPQVDYISDPDNKDPNTDLPVESGVVLNINREGLNTAERHRSLKESYLNFFDAQSLQFRHLLEYLDTSGVNQAGNPIQSFDPSPSDIRLGDDGLGPKTQFFGSEGDFKSSLYLASFLRTHRNNEDPTILGFDFSIRLSNSPMFNGTLEKFLTDEGTENTELSNRLELFYEFQRQFLSFFKSYDPNHISENLPSAGQFTSFEKEVSSPKSENLTKGLFDGNGYNNTRNPSKDYMNMYMGSAAKAYYIQSISGLDKLNESNDFGGLGKRFVEYGKDFLTLKLNEDVSQNMGYLASLYKNLTWSRERGRLAIPENLLRFEVILDITEVRNYVRVYQTKRDDPNFTGPTSPENPPSQVSKFKEIADYTSKYRYYVHECQFIFDKMPHGETLTQGNLEASSGLEIKIYFKHSNLRFMKFEAPSTLSVSNDNYSDYISRYTGNNLQDNETWFGVKFVDNSSIRTDEVRLSNLVGGSQISSKQYLFGNPYTQKPNTGNTAPINHPVSVYDLNPSKAISVNPGLSDLQRRREINRRPNFFDKLLVGSKDAYKSFKNQVLNAGINFVNRKIVDAASLINRSLNQIYNATPVVGGINGPKNIYDKPNEWEQAYVDFLGPGLKTFFENPLNFRQVGQPGETLADKVAKTRREVGSIGNGFSGISSVSFLGNSADTGSNKTLKEIVDGNPAFGNNNANTGIQSEFFGDIDAFSNNPSIGNSADPGNNKTLKQIVDSNPGIGNGFSGASSIPFLGNSADEGTNLKLQQIVDNNPNLGIPGSLITTNPSIGNNAEDGFNLTLEQLVAESASLGIPGTNIPINPSLGNNAEPGTNLPLQTIVDKDPNLGIPGSNIPTDPSLGNNAESTGKNLTLQQLVDGDPDFGNNAGITTTPSLGNNADPGENSTNDSVVSQNTTLKNPFIGNSGELGNNVPNDVVVDQNSSIRGAGIGNNAQFGQNQLNDSVVLINSEVEEPSEGNSANEGSNIPNDSVVVQNTSVDDPELGNSANESSNSLNDDVVLDNTSVIDPELGNSANDGANIPNQTIVTQNTRVEDASIGNNATTGYNIPNDKVVLDNTEVEDADEGNSALLGKSKKSQEIVTEKSIVESSSEGNSALTGKNIDRDSIVNKNTSLVSPDLGNNAEISINLTKEEKISNVSNLEQPSLGNNAQLGSNLQTNTIISLNSDVVNAGLGNSGLESNNIEKDFIVKSNSDVENPSLGNSGRIGSNSLLGRVVNSNTRNEDSDLGNNAQIGPNSLNQQKVSLNSNVNDAELGNSAFLSQNLTLQTKVSNSTTIESVQGTSQNIPLTTQVKINTNLEQPEIGNSALTGPNTSKDGYVEQNSFVNNSEIGNSSQAGENKTNDYLVFENGQINNPEVGNSAQSGSTKDLEKVISQSSKLDNTSVGNGASSGKNSNLEDLLKYSNNSMVSTPIDWTTLRFPRTK
jgi:hypothetical protein